MRELAIFMAGAWSGAMLGILVAALCCAASKAELPNRWDTAE